MKVSVAELRICGLWTFRILTFSVRRPAAQATRFYSKKAVMKGLEYRNNERAGIAAKMLGLASSWRRLSPVVELWSKKAIERGSQRKAFSTLSRAGPPLTR